METVCLKTRLQILILLLILGNLMYADYIYVDDDNTGGPWDGSPANPYQSIQDAVSASLGGSTIVVMQGTYAENVSISSKMIKLTSVDPEDSAIVASTIIDAQLLDSVLAIQNSSVTIQGFTITNGLADSGGGIYCDNSYAVVKHCNIHTNRTRDGGYGQIGGHGGGIYGNLSTLEVRHTIIADNETGVGGADSEYLSWSYSGGSGAGIYIASSTLTIADTTIQHNTTGTGGDSDKPGDSGDGGGLYCLDSSITMTNCSIVENQTGEGLSTWGQESGGSGNGGGVVMDSCSQSLIQNCVIIQNATGDVDGGLIFGGDAGNGGGVYSAASSPVFIHCLIAENTAGDGGDAEQAGDGGSGGGLYCTASPQLIHCSLADNTAGMGGTGVFSNGTDGTGGGMRGTASLIIENCIIWDNSPDQLTGYNCSNVAYSDIDDGVCAGSNGNITIAPLFADPSASDYHLKSQAGRWTASGWAIDVFTSACIDSGNPADIVNKEPNPNGNRVNMGAYGNTIQASKSMSGIGPDPMIECVNPPSMDTNYDCKVNLADFIKFACQWLACGYDTQEGC